MRIKFLSLPVAAMMLAACGGSAPNSSGSADPNTTESLAKAYEDCWYTGVSVNQWEVAANSQMAEGRDYTGMVSADQTANWDKIVSHFNWVVAENCMKSEVIHPEKDRYDFTLADQLVEKAKAANLKVMGHCLIWHSQCPQWFHHDKDGNLVDKETLKANMKDHITTVLTHFKGKVDAWDVCNECFEDDGSFRNSLFYQILGEEFIPLAFQYAYEADPNIELYYNDYSMNKASKVEGVCKFFKPLIEGGLKVSAICMQGHVTLQTRDSIESVVNQYNHSIECIKALGVKTGFSELDLSILPRPNGQSGANVSDLYAYREEMDPYREGLPEEVQARADEYWCSFYKMLMKHKESIGRVSFWCFNDANSWRNDFPIKGRCDYATLFDRNSQPKSTVQKLIDLRKE